jgi:hypothetical protein
VQVYSTLIPHDGLLLLPYACKGDFVSAKSSLHFSAIHGTSSLFESFALNYLLRFSEEGFFLVKGNRNEENLIQEEGVRRSSPRNI